MSHNREVLKFWTLVFVMMACRAIEQPHEPWTIECLRGVAAQALHSSVRGLVESPIGGLVDPADVYPIVCASGSWSTPSIAE
eukprot:6387159-Amphidinium_carterae.2